MQERKEWREKEKTMNDAYVEEKAKEIWWLLKLGQKNIYMSERYKGLKDFIRTIIEDNKVRVSWKGFVSKWSYRLFGMYPSDDEALLLKKCLEEAGVEVEE